MITAPASAAAAAICWLTRWQSTDASYAGIDRALRFAASRHGERCDWCDYPADNLLVWITAFNETVDVAWFERLPREQQRALTDAALHGPVS